MTIHPWPLIASKRIFDAGLFEVTRDRARSPRTLEERDFCIVHMVDWLTVVPLANDGRLVFVRQYRHGSREAGLELPGGLHDAPGQRPEQGAARELAEETGYAGGAWSYLGELRPQPALLSNRVHVYLAKGLRLAAEQRLDASEDIEVVLIEPCELRPRIAAGEITNAMTIAALALAHFAGHL